MTKIDEELVVLPEDEQVSRGKELMSLLFEQQFPRSPSKAGSEKKLGNAKVGDIDWNIIVKQTFIEVVIPPCQGARRRAMSDSALPHFDKSEQQWKSFVSDKLQDMSDASTNVSLEADEDLDANLLDSFISSGSSPSEGEPEVRENQGCWSSDGEQVRLADHCGEPDSEVSVQQAVPYQQPPCPEQYVGSSGSSMLCWVPVAYGANPPAMCSPLTGVEQAATGFDRSHTGFDQSPAQGLDQAATCFDQRAARFGQTPMGFTSSSYAPMQWGDHAVSTVNCHIDSDGKSPEWRTTVMIRNMPNNYTRGMLLELVDSMGFAGTYDFAYLPVDFQSQAGLGYAFLNFTSIANAQLCFDRFEGFSNWTVPSEKVCTVTWSSPTQGLESHIERYKNSPVMHPSIPDDWKPVLIQQGMRFPFPPPTKPIKFPKVREHPTAKSA